MRQIDKERFIRLFLFLHELDRMVGQEIRNIGAVFILYPFPIYIYAGIIIFPLPFESFPMIKSRLRSSRVISHVPFSKESSFISAFLQILRKKYQPFRKRSGIIYHLMAMRIHTGQDRSPARRRKRSCDECIFDMRSFLGHSIHIRSFQPRDRMHESHVVISMIVRKNKDNI